MRCPYLPSHKFKSTVRSKRSSIRTLFGGSSILKYAISETTGTQSLGNILFLILSFFRFLFLVSSKLDYHSPINVSFRWPHPSLLPVTETGFVFSLLWAVSKSSAPSISALGPSLSSSLSLTRLAYRLPNRLTLKTTLPPFSFSLLHRSTSRGIGSRPTQPSRLKISPPPPKAVVGVQLHFAHLYGCPVIKKIRSIIQPGNAISP